MGIVGLAARHWRKAMTGASFLLAAAGLRGDLADSADLIHDLWDAAAADITRTALLVGALALFLAANLPALIRIFRHPKMAPEYTSRVELIDLLSSKLLKRGYGIDPVDDTNGLAVRVDRRDGSNPAFVGCDNEDGQPLFVGVAFSASEDEIETQERMSAAVRSAMVHDIRMELARFGVMSTPIPNPLTSFYLWTTRPIGDQVDMGEIVDALDFVWRAAMLVSSTYLKAAETVQGGEEEPPPWVADLIALLPPPVASEPHAARRARQPRAVR